MPILTVRQAIQEALREEMRRDENVFLLGEDIAHYGSSYGVTKGFVDEFGEKRVKDTPISETAIIGAATGAALGGLRPVPEIMSINFALQAIDQVVNHTAKLSYMFGGQMKVPMVMRTPAGWSQLSATHSQTLELFFAYVPGLKVVMPSTPYDHKGLLKSAIRDDDPVIFIEHALLYGMKGEVPEEEYLVPIGKSVVRRPGKDVTVVSYSRMAVAAVEAANDLAKEGIDVEVIDLRTLRPLDLEPVLESVKKTNRLVIAEEGWKSFGIGAEIAARVSEEAFDYLDAPIRRVAGVEVPAPYNKHLEMAAFPHKANVVEAIRDVLK
ncbi:MAG TPA: alpha-ketoacid dehydrogenase subunit beta [Stenomitos sp.]